MEHRLRPEPRAAVRPHQLELFNWGEPFFNRALPELIAYATQKGVVRTIISSNLSFPLSEAYIRAVVGAGLTHLAAAVDGADRQGYEQRPEIVEDILEKIV